MADTFTDAIEAKASGNPVFLPEGLDLVKTFESFKPTAYYDLDDKAKKGELTVGYGFTKFDIPGIKEGYQMDRTSAEKLLPTLITRKYGQQVLSNVKVPLSDNQYSALASFAYNVGPENFRKSTLLKKVNSGDFAGAASEFDKWTKAGGEVLNGLVRRRAAEKALFTNDIPTLGRILEEQKYGGAGTATQELKPSKKEPKVSAFTPMPDEPNEQKEVAPSEESAFAKGINFEVDLPQTFFNPDRTPIVSGLTGASGLNPKARV